MLLWSILQYFWPALSDNRSCLPILVFFLSVPSSTTFGRKTVTWQFRPNVIPEYFFRPNVVLGETSHRPKVVCDQLSDQRNSFRRIVVHPNLAPLCIIRPHSSQITFLIRVMNVIQTPSTNVSHLSRPIFQLNLLYADFAYSQGRSWLPCDFDADLWWPLPNQT